MAARGAGGGTGAGRAGGVASFVRGAAAVAGKEAGMGFTLAGEGSCTLAVGAGGARNAGLARAGESTGMGEVAASSSCCSVPSLSRDAPNLRPGKEKLPLVLGWEGALGGTLGVMATSFLMFPEGAVGGLRTETSICLISAGVSSF